MSEGQCNPCSNLAYSPLVGQIVFASNTVTRTTTSKQYDFLNRLNSISSTILGTPRRPQAPGTGPGRRTQNLRSGGDGGQTLRAETGAGPDRGQRAGKPDANVKC